MHCLIDSPLVHGYSDIFGSLLVEVVVCGQTVDLPDLVVGYLGLIGEIVIVDIVLHLLGVSLVLRVDPQDFGEALLEQIIFLKHKQLVFQVG